MASPPPRYTRDNRSDVTPNDSVEVTGSLSPQIGGSPGGPVCADTVSKVESVAIQDPTTDREEPQVETATEFTELVGSTSLQKSTDSTSIVNATANPDQDHEGTAAAFETTIVNSPLPTTSGATPQCVALSLDEEVDNRRTAAEDGSVAEMKHTLPVQTVPGPPQVVTFTAPGTVVATSAGGFHAGIVGKGVECREAGAGTTATAPARPRQLEQTFDFCSEKGSDAKNSDDVEGLALGSDRHRTAEEEVIQQEFHAVIELRFEIAWKLGGVRDMRSGFHALIDAGPREKVSMYKGLGDVLRFLYRYLVAVFGTQERL